MRSGMEANLAYYNELLLEQCLLASTTFVYLDLRGSLTELPPKTLVPALLKQIACPPAEGEASAKLQAHKLLPAGANLI